MLTGWVRNGTGAAAMVLCAAVGVGQQKAAVPAWYDHAVIYEVYPRSFQDTNGDGIGDLKGVTQRLDYLQRLGVDAIWLTPFFPSPNRDFGYDISNYTDVAPEYGTMADWDALVAGAKQRGIRVLVDFVVNHTSDQHPWFVESRSSRTNPKRDWYIWKDGKADGAPPTNWTSIFGGPTWTKDAATDQWYYHIFLAQQPDVNWANPGLRKAMFDVARFWLEHGASGFRLDATPYLTEDPLFPEDPHPPATGGAAAALEPYNAGRPENHQILRELRTILNGYPGQPVLLGESTTPDIASLAEVYGQRRDEIQLPMDFLYGNQRKLDATVFKKQADDAEGKLGGQTPVFFFSSHDHERQWSLLGDGRHNDQMAKLSAAMTLLLRGTALVYYGEELGMATATKEELAEARVGPKRPLTDPRDGERTPMQWTGGKEAGFTTGEPWLPVQSDFRRVNVGAEESEAGSLLRWYQQLIRMRKTAPFAEGAYVPLESGNKEVFAFGRGDSRTGAVVVLNMSDSAQTVTLTGLAAGVRIRSVLLSSYGAETPKGATVTVAPWATVVLGY